MAMVYDRKQVSAWGAIQCQDDAICSILLSFLFRELPFWTMTLSCAYVRARYCREPARNDTR